MKLEIVETFNIKNEDGTDNKRLIYMLTANSSPKDAFKDMVEKPFKIKAYVKFKDTDKDKLITSIYTDDGAVLSGDSKTLRDSLDELVETFEEDIVNMDVYIKADVSKNNRTFLTLCLA